MNKLARRLVLIGAVIIAILLILLYFASRKMLQEVEFRLNQGMEFARIQVEQAQTSEYGIQRFEYTPFKCSGLMDYKCKTDLITLYMDDFTTKQHDVREKIQFRNFTLSSEDIKSKNHLSFKIKTAIEYPTIDRFFGDSSKEALISFFNHSADALLPNQLECAQDYLYKIDEGITHTITANTQCHLTSQMFDMRLDVINLFAPNVERAHILGILYEIAMAMNGDANKEELQAKNIPHELDSVRLAIQPRQSFQDYIAKNEKLTPAQQQSLKTQLDANLSLMRLGGLIWLKQHFGENSAALINGLSDIAQDKIRELDIQLTLKNPPNFQPLKMFKDMSLSEWLSYFNKNYIIEIEAKK